MDQNDLHRVTAEEEEDVGEVRVEEAEAGGEEGDRARQIILKHN